MEAKKTSNKTIIKLYTKHHANFIRIRKAISRAIQHRSDPNVNMINLSKHSFTKRQYDLVNKNLNFCPRPGQYNTIILKKDLESFNRKIKLKAFLCKENAQKQNAELANKEPNIKSKTNWQPKKNIMLLKCLLKQSIKILWKDFQIKINYLKII